MGRIADEEIDRLKQQISLERLVEAQGIELKRHGADLLGLCPFHDDHAPSLLGIASHHEGRTDPDRLQAELNPASARSKNSSPRT
jgi:hypothetical protein